METIPEKLVTENSQNSSANEKPKKKKAKLVLKAPTQERSRQTVSTILEACSKILVKEGFFGVTTDKIAREAGVSIGSLYQFFGNKESVVSAVIHNLLEQDKLFIMQKIQEANIDSLPPREKVSKAIDIAIQAYSINSELRAKLQNIQMYLADADFFKSTMDAYQEISIKLFPDLHGRNIKKVAYLAVMAFYGLMNYALVNNQDITKDPELIREVHILFEGYLFGSANSVNN